MPVYFSEFAFSNALPRIDFSRQNRHYLSAVLIFVLIFFCQVFIPLV